MTEFTINRDDLQPGDKIVSLQPWSSNVTVERNGPDQDTIYSQFVSGQGTSLYMNNGRGFWHEYKITGGIGMQWGEFAQVHNIESVDSLRVVGTRKEE